MTVETLGRQNPWWTEVSLINEDPYLAEYDHASLKWEPPHQHSLKLDRDLIYILLGPRQVGKTTLFKLLIRDLLLGKAIPSRNVAYLNCEALGPQKPQELAEALRNYLLWARVSSQERIGAVDHQPPGKSV